MNQLTFQQLNLTIDKYDLILFDLWGVIVENGKAYPGVVDAINQISKKTKIMFLTNAPRPNFKVQENLNNWGLVGVEDDMIVTSGDIARQMIFDHRAKIGNKIPKIYHLGEDRNKDLLIDLEYKLTQNLDDAEILLLSLYRDDDEDICEFDQILRQAAKQQDLLIICSNPDTIIPKHGALRYCAGYFAKVIEKFGGKVAYTGKPEKIIYDCVLQRHNHIDNKRILMVGDTLETDITGANNVNISSALTLSGNAKPFHDMYESMDMKLSALYNRAKEVGAMPNFVTSIV